MKRNFSLKTSIVRLSLGGAIFLFVAIWAFSISEKDDNVYLIFFFAGLGALCIYHFRGLIKELLKNKA